MTFISREPNHNSAKPQFSDLAELNITLYIVLLIYEHICGVDTNAFAQTKTFVYVNMYTGYRTQ